MNQTPTFIGKEQCGFGKEQCGFDESNPYSFFLMMVLRV